MQFKLGKKPARPDAVKMKFGSYFDAAKLPPVPALIGHPWLVRIWGMLGNDRAGDCVWAGFCHETALLHADSNLTVPTFTTKTVFADYHDATGFNPGDPSTDQGTDLQDGASYRQKTGIIDILGQRHKIDIYTALRVGDLNEIALAVFLFGAAGIGVRLPDTAEQQFNRMEPWTVEKGASIVGGHYIPCVGRNSLGDFLFVSWGRLTAATPNWVQTYMDEGICYVDRDRLNRNNVSPQNYNLAQLTDDYHQLTRT